MKTVGGSIVGHVIYEKDKPSYRSEIDQVMAAKPDFLYLNGYATDTVVVLRDLWKAGIDLPKFCRPMLCRRRRPRRNAWTGYAPGCSRPGPA